VTVEKPRKEQILTAAARLFAESGFRNVSLAEIGRAVGVSGPALYRHFDKKDDILGSILINISQSLLDESVALGNRIDDPRELLDALISAHVDFAVSRPELIILQWREFSTLRGDDRRTVRRLQRTYIDYWSAVLMRLDPELSIPEAGATVVAAFGLMNSTPFSASRLAPEEAQPLLKRLTRNMLGL
jgi:AcrR family transcriptional regulator